MRRVLGRKLVLGVTLASMVLVAPATAQASFAPTRPPGPADARGLKRAFLHVHGTRPRPHLVGFRLAAGTSSCAGAFYPAGHGPNGGYARGVTEFYVRRSGHRWAHVSHARLACRGNLSPLFLWRIQSSGSGRYVEQETTTSSQDSSVQTDRTEDDFSWSTTFGRKRYLTPQDGIEGGAYGRPQLTMQMTSTSTDSADPSSNSSCQGPVRSVGRPILTSRLGRRGRVALKVFLTENLATLQPPCDGGGLPDDGQLLGGVKIKRKLGFVHVAPFTVHFDSSNPAFVKQVKPHQSETETVPPDTTTTTRDLSFSGTLTFTLVGVHLPHGVLGVGSPVDR